MASSARIDELRKKFEENPRRYFAPLANEYRKAGDIDQAISICKEYLPQQPGHMSGHIVYGQALYEARQYEEARSVFETALALDPENLIALRHLGDIALIVGDIDGARGWYGRVLEADPRNDEIQAQLKSLESVGPAAAPTPMSMPAVEAPPAAVSANDPAASAAEPLPALELAAEPAPAEPAPTEPAPATPTPASSAATVVVPAMPMPTIERTVEIPATPPSAPAQSLSTAPTAEITLDQVPVPAVPDLEKAVEAPAADLSVEKTTGFEPTATESGEPAPAFQADGLEATTPPPTDAPPIDSFTLDGLETTAMSSPPAAEASPSAASESVASADALSASIEVPAVAADEPLPAPSELTFLDVGETSPAPQEAVSSQAAAPEPPASEPSAPEPSAPEPAPAQPPAAAAPEPPMAESKPFVTETMAELYEQQGHRDEALRVYRALLEQRPNDAHIRQRIEQLEGKRGPTIRELLARVAARRPAPRSAPVGPVSPPVEAVATENAAVASPEASPVEAVPPASAVEPIPPAAARRDPLGQLFGSPAVSGADENAAATLSAAFSNDARANGGGSTSQALSGTPAHPASKDLSLDAVFGTQSPVPPPAGSFSFDQFFSERATAEQPASGGGAAGEGQETKDDVAKFTQWLEGLKQR